VKLTTKQLAIDACAGSPEPLASIYQFVHHWRPDVPEHSVRARLHEAMKEGRIVRVAEGVYFARSGEAQMLLVEGDAWDVMKELDDHSIDLLLSDVPGKFGREWAGTGTTRPHRLLGGRTYHQPELDADFFREAMRILKKDREWNTLNLDRREKGEWPRGGAACVIRVPLENKTTRPSIQSMIRLAESLGLVYCGEILVALDVIGMGYDAGRDLGAKWLVFHAGERNGVLWDLSATNVIDAKRIRNPAKPGFVKHEAEKDPLEFIQIIKAYSRPGDVVADLFCGVAKWVKEALKLGRHVIVSDIDTRWVDAVVTDFQNVGDQSHLEGSL
jgi:DNA methylase